MSEELPPGYIYRIPRTSVEELRTLVAKHMEAGQTFGGAAQWDFDPKRGRDNLRPVAPFASGDIINTDGDFGHAFDADIEIRWKRRDNSDYDVLILSEAPQSIADAVPLETGEAQQWRVRVQDNTALIQTGTYAPIRYVDYLAPNGAVQFQRFKGDER